MAQIIREITADVSQLNRFQAIVAKQYDKQSRFLKVRLTDMGSPIFVDSGAAVVINARREDETARTFSGEVNPDGTVTVPLTYWMLELDGTVKCDISVISNSDTVLTTTLFELEVEEAAADDTSISNDDDYGILVTLIDEVNAVTAAYEASAKKMRNEYKASVEQAVADCNTAVTAAQLVTAPFYIVDNDNHKTYTAALQITNGKPVCVYEEFTGGN